MNPKGLNILFLSYNGGLAGSTKSIAFLSDGLAKRGHRVFVGCREGTKLWALIEEGAAQGIHIPFRGKWDPRTWRQIADLVSEHQIQVINAQSSKDRYASIFTKWFKRLPCLIYHTRRQRPTGASWLLKRWFYTQGTDKIIVVSEALKQTFIDNGYPAKHLKVIHNGTPTQQYEQPKKRTLQSLRKEFGIAEGTTVIGCISRWKQQNDLIEALRYLPDDYVIFFAGFRAALARPVLEKVKPSQRIILAGELPFDKALECYRLFTVSVLCSVIDGFGLVLVEAMAMGAPVVATDAQGIRDVVRHGINGLLYPSRDSEKLAQQILSIADDEQMASQLIDKGYETAYHTFSLDKTVTQYESFFTDEIECNGKQ
ncbi:MAG: glycosyltransferase family 4 protein [Bacteroidota bacterium]